MGYSLTNLPSIDQGALELFQDSFYALSQQTSSKLVNSNVFVFMPSRGKTNNLARMGRLELTEVDTRNPIRQYSDYALDNRHFTKRRFTRSITIDAKDDINELLRDPTSDIVMQLHNAKERVIDRIGIAAAVGDVQIGAPGATPTLLSADDDGVKTVDATTGLVYESIKEVTRNYINSDLQYSDFRGSVLCLTGEENSALMGEAEFINNDYITGKPVDDSVMFNAGTYRIELFAGSSLGDVIVGNPIIPETATQRSCVVLAPRSVAMSMELDKLDVKQNPVLVNSYDITIDFWINAMRIEGVKVQKITTTI